MKDVSWSQHASSSHPWSWMPWAQLLPAASSRCSFDFSGMALKLWTEINSFSLQVLMYHAILITATGRETKTAVFLHLLVRFCTSHKQRHWRAVQLSFLKCTAKAPEDWANTSLLVKSRCVYCPLWELQSLWAQDPSPTVQAGVCPLDLSVSLFGNPRVSNCSRWRLW